MTIYVDFIQKQLNESSNRPLLIGLSGPQGSGKTTLTNNLSQIFKERDIHLITLSLDDYYLTHEEQLHVHNI